MRGSAFFLGLTAVLVVLLGVFAARSVPFRSPETTAIEQKRSLVRALGLGDFAIWTEARYTRHPSQADLFSAHQDGPSSLEHFPAGSLVTPPGAPLQPGRGFH